MLRLEKLNHGEQAVVAEMQSRVRTQSNLNLAVRTIYGAERRSINLQWRTRNSRKKSRAK